MAAGLGRAELEFVTSVTAPLYWVIPAADGGGRLQARNGSAFFLDAGAGVFGLTAAHVIRAMQKARSKSGPISCQLGHDIVFDLDGQHRLIAIDDAIDIATFRIAADEIRAIGKTVLTGYHKAWPPSPPQQERGIYFAGFPEVSTLWLSLREMSFGAAPGSGVASSISETDVSSLIERQHLIDVMGTGLPPENFVIYEGPNISDKAGEAIAGLEIIRARRAHFLRPDGSLDQRLWASLER